MIAERFGSEVLKIVEGLTDGMPDDHGVKPPWRERKELYVAHLENADLYVVLVSGCDKFHNAMAIADDHLVIGEAIFERFSQPKYSMVWYYKELERIISSRLGSDHRLVRKPDATLARWAC